MKSRTPIFLKILMWVIAAMHLIVGGGLNLVPGFAPFMAEVYGAEVQWTPELGYILKLLGAFMFTLGVLAAVAALNPARHRVIMYGLVLLFLTRATMRLVWAQEIQGALGISPSRNIANMVFFSFVAASVVFLDRLAHTKTAGV